MRKLTDFGAFIEIEEGIDGLVHVSDLSWTKRVKHPSEVVKKGQVVQAVILNIDAPNRRLSLGVKQLQPDAWERFFQTHQVGDMVHGRVCRAGRIRSVRRTGAGRGRLVPSLRGSGLLRPTNPTSRPSPIGEEMDFKIIKMNEAEKKIGLSLRA